MRISLICIIISIPFFGHTQRDIDAEKAYLKAYDISMAFIRNHPDSLTSIMLLDFYYSDLTYDTAQFYMNLLAKNNSSHQAFIKLSDKAKLADKSRPGTKINNFRIFDFYKKDISIEDIASTNKMILLDFWGSWCAPCRRNSPILKHLYSKFKDNGFEIVGISTSENDIRKWQNAIHEDGIDIWYQHIDSSKKIQTDLGIEFVPAYLLLDNNLKIVARFNGRWKGLIDLELFISEFFKSN